MFERPRSGERAILVHVNLDAGFEEDALDELRELAESAGAEVLSCVTASRHTPEPRFFVGSGKADELADQVNMDKAELVVFNHALSPSQERNLEKHLQCRVIDRIGLILDIFAQRAQTHEGKLQVELAQLKHLSTRLVRGWTHLERQKGGIGLRGPGETQLETDRRLLNNRVRHLEARLVKVRQQRDQGRRNRQRHDVPSVSLVGYTNAGKSTLFNALTQADVYQADQLFATLDPTVRRFELPDGGKAVLADTVGFIRHLPHELVAAFRSTLQETRDADLLLHVIDVREDGREQRIATVHEVLEEIGAAQVPMIEVFNKCDLVDIEPRIDRDADGLPRRVWIAALAGQGLELIGQAVSEYFHRDSIHGWVRLGPDQGRLRARLFEIGAVRQEIPASEGGSRVELELSDRDFRQLVHYEGLNLESQ